MEKLFDLMVTGFKYQTLCSHQAQEILQVVSLSISYARHTVCLSLHPALHTGSSKAKTHMYEVLTVCCIVFDDV